MPHIPFSDDLVDPDKILPSGLRYLLADGVPSEMDQFRVKLGQNGLNGEKVFVPLLQHLPVGWIVLLIKTTFRISRF